MRVEGTFKTPIHGISTLVPRNRAEGHAEVQENFRSDPVQKLTRRPPLVFTETLAIIDSAHDFKYHEYRRNGNLFSVAVNVTTGDVLCFKNYELIQQESGLSSYLTGGDLVLKSVDNTTYILNKNTVARRGVSTDTTVKVTHLNIISALNYGEEVTVGFYVNGSGTTPVEVTYSVPDLGVSEPNYDRADKARATKAVALNIRQAINNNITLSSRYEVIALGSTVAIYHKTDDVWVEAYVATGQGDRSCRMFNERIENVEGLPLFAVHGTIITVKPNPSREAGTYYLKAERTADDNGITTKYLEECVWTETRTPHEAYDLDATTLPHTVMYDEDTELFVVGAGDWSERRTGDDTSCPVPDFIDKRILDIGHFQNRLVFIAGGQIFMTETDDYDNWFRASALKLLVTDPVGIGSNAVDTEEIEHISSHNRDLLLVSPNGQFKISGTEAVTPQTVSMPKVSSYTCQTSVPPVNMGDSVILAIQQGESGGLINYTTKKATEQEFGENVSKHVVGLLDGNITRIVGSVNSDMVVVMTDNSGTNTLFVYEQFSEQGKRIQSSWSTWKFPDDINIVDLKFVGDNLKVITRHLGRLSIYSVDLYSRVNRNTDEVFLDYLVQLNSPDGLEAELESTAPLSPDTVIVQGDGTLYPLEKIGFYNDSSREVVFDTPVSDGSPCELYMGVPVTARYIPTRPFIRDEQERVITTDRLRVARWNLYVADTHEVVARVHSDYVSIDDQIFTGRVMGQTNNLIGEKTAYTGDLLFSYSQDADLAKIEFRTEGYLGLTISGISWNGQYHKTSRRI
jgi:hypothetical protein